MTGARAITLLVAAVVFVFGGVTGFRLLTTGPDPVDAAPTCTPSVVAEGEPLDSNLVKVNVFNASQRSGLANRVTINLQANGFQGGEIGNSTSSVQPGRVAILTSDREDPRVRLVAAQFRDKVAYAEPDIQVENGIIVIVGDGYRGLKEKTRTKITSDREIQVCEPVVPVP